MQILSREPEATRRLSVTIRRTDAGAKGQFSVPFRPPMTLLDVLFEIQRVQDPSLAFRFFCRSGLCGTCTVRHNGTPVLACQILVEPHLVIRVDPLGGLPVIRDLIVDIGPFATAWAAALHAGGPVSTAGPDQLDTETLDVLDAARECIACAACFSACPVAGSDPAFPGPAALGRESLVTIDPRFGAANEAVAAGAAVRASGCHSIGACSIVCPRDVDPARLIRRLRQRGKEAAR